MFFCCFHLCQKFSVHRVSLVFPVDWCGQGQSGGPWLVASGKVCLALTWGEGSADLCLCSDSGPSAFPWGLVMTLDLTWRVQDNHSISRSLIPSFGPHEVTESCLPGIRSAWVGGHYSAHPHPSACVDKRTEFTRVPQYTCEYGRSGQSWDHEHFGIWASIEGRG